jgi:hypothetical protein
MTKTLSPDDILKMTNGAISVGVIEFFKTFVPVYKISNLDNAVGIAAVAKTNNEDLILSTTAAFPNSKITLIFGATVYDPKTSIVSYTELEGIILHPTE